MRLLQRPKRRLGSRACYRLAFIGIQPK
ncbi:unnamed protein product [Diplocarpon coronariae]